MKLTDEQNREFIEFSRNLGLCGLSEWAQKVADYLQPLFAAEMLRPVTDEEKERDDAYMREGKNPFWRSSFDRILADRKARYCPAPVDPAVEAARNVLRKWGSNYADECNASEIVAAVDAARGRK